MVETSRVVVAVLAAFRAASLKPKPDPVFVADVGPDFDPEEVNYLFEEEAGDAPSASAPDPEWDEYDDLPSWEVKREHHKDRGARVLFGDRFGRRSRRGAKTPRHKTAWRGGKLFHKMPLKGEDSPPEPYTFERHLEDARKFGEG